ncbi:hypothetical protein ACFTAO_38270 [Paenibacillus rhizoplanae]
MVSFLFYGFRKKPTSFHLLILAGLYSVLYRLNLVSAEFAKSAFFGFMKYMDDRDLKHFYNTKLKPHIYTQALKGAFL